MASVKEIDDAMEALSEANLTEEGLQFLSGAVAAHAPGVIHATLATLRRVAEREPERSIRYFKIPID